MWIKVEHPGRQFKSIGALSEIIRFKRDTQNKILSGSQLCQITKHCSDAEVQADLKNQNAIKKGSESLSLSDP
jgi:hypothetical protein